MCSSVEERMFAHDAMKAANTYLDCSCIQIAMAIEFLHATCQNLRTLSVIKKKKCITVALQMIKMATTYLAMAICCVKLDSDLLDIQHEDRCENYYYPPKMLRIDTVFQNDNQSDQQIRLSKNEIRQLLDIFQLDETIYVQQNHYGQGGPYYRYNREELFIYLLSRICS